MEEMQGLGRRMKSDLGIAKIVGSNTTRFNLGIEVALSKAS